MDIEKITLIREVKRGETSCATIQGIRETKKKAELSPQPHLLRGSGYSWDSVEQDQTFPPWEDGVTQGQLLDVPPTPYLSPGNTMQVHDTISLETLLRERTSRHLWEGGTLRYCLSLKLWR